MRSGLVAEKGLRTGAGCIVLTLFLLALVTSPLKAGREALAPEADGARLWTFMVWLNGDNNLEHWAIEDINEKDRRVCNTAYEGSCSFRMWVQGPGSASARR